MTHKNSRLRPGLLAVSSVLALLAVRPASAESLQDAMVAAYTSNPSLLGERARLRATDETLAMANSAWRPRVNISGSTGRGWDNRADIRSDSWSAEISASQQIFDFGRTEARRDAAKANIRAGRANLAGVESETLLSTVQAYMNVVRDMKLVELSENQIAVLGRERQAAQDRFDVGEITRTNVAQAEASLLGAQTGLISAKAQLEAARAAYVKIVGHTPKDLDASPPLPSLPRTLEDAINIALQQNPNLMAAREGANAADAGVDSAVSAMLPSVNLSASYSRGESKTNSILAPGRGTTDSTSIGLGASIPLYQGGSEWSELRQSKAQASQARLGATMAERQVIEAVTNAWANLAAAQAAIQSAEAQIVAAQTAYEGVAQEAQVGARTTLDVLNSQQALLDARSRLVTNRTNMMIAAYQLLSAMGRLSAAQISLPVEIYDPVPNSDSVAGQLIGVGAD